MNTKLNRPLIEKMIKRIEDMPESYEQGVFECSASAYKDRPAPECGTVACLAGEAIICDAPTVEIGLKRLRDDPAPDITATKLLRLKTPPHELFHETAKWWPDEHRKEFRDATDYKGRARAAVNLLRAILRTDGKILEVNQ